jgi:hypothetical protein
MWTHHTQWRVTLGGLERFGITPELLERTLQEYAEVGMGDAECGETQRTGNGVLERE